MHDRRIDGVTHTFGNYGALFRNAMTWWDHETETVWSQPWGRGIEGEYRGVELFLVPSQVTTWERWRASHPETRVMVNDLDLLRPRRPAGFRPDYVLGILVEGRAKAYRFADVAGVGLVNDTFAGLPIVVWASESGLGAHLRRLGDRVLTFRVAGDRLEDEQTGSRWDPVRGLALDGPLTGSALQPIPAATAFEWAWRDFYPETETFRPAP